MAKKGQIFARVRREGEREGGRQFFNCSVLESTVFIKFDFFSKATRRTMRAAVEKRYSARRLGKFQ